MNCIGHTKKRRTEEQMREICGKKASESRDVTSRTAMLENSQFATDGRRDFYIDEQCEALHQ